MSNNDTATENDRLQRRIEQLELDQEALSRETEQARWDNQVLRRQLEDAQGENKRLRDEVARVQEEASNIAKSVNIAWQQGYLAGQQAAMADMPAKSFVETLAEAARAATAYGGNENQAQEQAQEVGGNSATATATVTATATTEAEPEAASAEHEAAHSETAQAEAPVAADAAQAAAAAAAPEPHPEAEAEEVYIAEKVRIEDPNILNDPFTAKLLNALGTDDSDEDDTIEEERPVFTASSDGIVSIETPAYEEPEAAQEHNEHDHDEHQAHETAEPSVTGAHTDFEQEPENPLPNAGANDKQFSAEELHNLFRNRYVRDDEPPEAKPATPEPAQSNPHASTTGGPSKKFVGANKQGTEQPAGGGMVRSYPPDIRRCCRLLGIVPEELSKRTVLDAWKKEMSKPGVHPDTGGDTEMAIYLNVAKETLMRWVEDQTPKLGKKFGAGGSKTAEANKPQAKQD